MSAAPRNAADELQQLQQRAYGPHADIQTDAVALARLHELQTGLGMRRHAEVVAEPRPPTSASALPLVADSAQDPPTQAAATSRRCRRWLVVAAAVAALAVGATATLGILALLSPRPDAVLRAAAVDADVDPALDGQFLNSFRIARGDLRAFEEYRGYQAWAGQASDGLTCLFVTSADRGLVAQSCTAPSIHPIADFQSGNGTVSLGGGPRGVLRFELNGTVVDVYDRAVSGTLAAS